MVQILKNKKVKVIICLMIILIMLVLTMKQSYAAGDVSSVIQQAWKQMESQIRSWDRLLTGSTVSYLNF